MYIFRSNLKYNNFQKFQPSIDVTTNILVMKKVYKLFDDLIKSDHCQEYNFWEVIWFI